MRPFVHPALLAIAVLLAGASLPTLAAADKKDAGTTSPKKKKATAPKFIPSQSQETPKERERRLLRECKGRPNAGACSGFAS